ncbi:MAG TPA: hypothetical protein VK081_03090 [Planctomycetota bacterium]|nr:hypothetical protein [Planctomycetota bacterium]
MKRLLSVALLVGAGCDGWAHDRIARLEADLRELRAAQAAAPADVGAALAPLREAIEAMLRRGDLERLRGGVLAAEVAQLAHLVQDLAGEARRAEVEALRGRIAELEQQLAEQNRAQAADRDLLLRALELTATRLEAFLRRTAPAPESAPPVEPRRSSALPWALGALTAALVVLAVLRRRRVVPRAVPLDLPVGPEAFVDAPEPVSGRAPLAGGRGPLPVRVEVGASDPGDARERVRRWLANEPRVLKAPAPELELRGATLQVRFFVQDGMPAAERASLAAAVLLRGQAESHAGRA